MKRFYIVATLLLLLLFAPIIWWFMSPQTTLNVAIIDKTVPTDSYREHLGITWLLNHKKYVQDATGKYDYEKDYYGFQPPSYHREGQVKALPKQYDAYDVIYLADTYGVYEEDLATEERAAQGELSEKVYGGLEEQEWSAILKRLDQEKPSLLIAEYNTFASPTGKKVQDRVTDYLGIDWSGWVGRYFDELNPEKNDEIPNWIVKTAQNDWAYNGGGFILVNDHTSEVIVLEDEKHVKNGDIQLVFTQEGQQKFGLKKSPSYNYWFDIVTPTNDGQTLAHYEWNLTTKGKQLLKDHEIPETFAAVVERRHPQSMSVYFAGDYNDLERTPNVYHVKGLTNVYRFLQKFSDESFYWSAYVPMTEKILEEFAGMNNKEKQVSSKDETLQTNARVTKEQFEILQDGEWTPMTIKGVNMGMGKPGAFPGEAAITEDEYYRWFQQIGEMNANTVRVYTLHPPGFYNALKRYNEHHEEKIYLFHGAWMNEEKLEESLDAFEPENLNDFQQEMKTLVDVIHGNKIVKERPGHASGTYRADVSEYVIGWILGIEWYPHMVLNTNETYTELGEFKGEYYETKNARAFEYWLAEQMEFVTAYEMDNYQWMRPMSFTNWVTTDILDHPAEPNEDEDLVSVDPNVIYTKGKMKEPGQFASYHVYPYYPDFFNFDQDYLAFKDHRGEKNSYAGYLHDLKKAHRLPLLIAEFGVPASRGLTHENPFGWNQGFHSEQEQGEILQRLYEDIMVEDMLGGLVFTWQDEWFKRTWNTVDYDNPNRRPFWSNAQTNEQQFGLLSFDRLKIKLDGNKTDWENDPLYENKDGKMKALYVDHDERYLYVRVDIQEKAQGYPIILLDVVPDQGNTTIENLPGLSFTNGLEQIIRLKKGDASLYVDQYYDFFKYQYGYELKMLDEKVKKQQKNSGIFTTEQYALNKSLYLPQQDETLPFSAYDTGAFIEGNGNPASKSYDSLADYHVNEDGMIELRIPWLLIHAKDPSQKEFIGDLYEEGIEASKKVEEIYIGALFLNDEDEVMEAFPSMKKQTVGQLKGYTWENWDEPLSEERLKQSYYILQKLFANY